MAVEAREAGPIDPEAMVRILEIARLLAGPFDLEPLLGEVINAGRTVLGADRGTVFLYDAGTRELYSKVTTGGTIGEIRFPIEKGIAGEAARNRQTIVVPDCYADPRFNPEVDRRTGYRTNCLIAVPLIGLDNELVGVIQLLNPAKGRIDALDVRIAEVVASQAAVAIQRVRLNDERIVKMKLERDLALARQIQMNVLPRELPVCPGYDVATFSQPAEETGGDIFDVVPLTGATCDGCPILLLIADATGHGIGPAISVTQVRAMLRMGLRLSAGLSDLVRHINEQLCADLGGSRFVTAFMGSVDPQTHRVHYHAAGQGPLLHYAATSGAANWYGASTLPLGIIADLEIEAPAPIYMERGDLLVLLTDGFYEYQNHAGKQLGKDRIGELVAQHRAKPAQAVMDAILVELKAFAAGAPQLDDLTGIIVKRSS